MSTLDTPDQANSCRLDPLYVHVVYILSANGRFYLQHRPNERKPNKICASSACKAWVFKVLNNPIGAASLPPSVTFSLLATNMTIVWPYHKLVCLKAQQLWQLDLSRCLHLQLWIFPRACHYESHAGYLTEGNPAAGMPAGKVVYLVLSDPATPKIPCTIGIGTFGKPYQA